MKSHQAFYNSQNQNAPKQNAIDEVLQKSDEVVKSYVEMIVTKYPKKIVTLENGLKVRSAEAKEIMDKAIKMVSDGSCGNAKTEEEADANLRKWGNGEMKKMSDDFMKSVDTLAESMSKYGISKPEIKEEPKPDFDVFGEMQKVSDAYFVFKGIYRKANMALEYLASLNVKNENTFEVTQNGPK